MIRFKRKKTYCQNCQYPLTANYNFCPNCGQENNDKLVSFGTLVGEFFSNYFSYDSRLVRSVKPFLFKPAFLTKEFLAGRRQRYMHPLRLYLVISFFYFLIFSFTVTHEMKDNQRTLVNFVYPNGSPVISHNIPDTLYINDSTVIFPLGVPDTLSPAENFVERNNTKDPEKMNFKFDDLSILQKEEVVPTEVLDSLGLKHSKINLLLAKQGIRLANESKGSLLNFFIKNASIMMFLLLPFFALILKVFYIRRKRLYIEHLTFTLHIHAFMFFMLLLAMIVDVFLFTPWTFSVASIIIFIYMYLSFRNMYQQSWLKTSVKIFLLFFTYTTVFSIFLFATIAVSFLLL